MTQLRYASGDAYLNSGRRSVFLFGMSGVGKTRIANVLRDSGEWYHYSVDYRIGKRYLHDQINDTIKKPAMRDPLLKRLLRSDSIVLRSNLAFKNLAPLSAYIGKPGDPDRGGLSFTEYSHRQALHRVAEMSATSDAKDFIRRADEIYEYKHFVCDSSGSVCEIADPEDPNDSIFSEVAAHMLPIWIRSPQSEHPALVARFARAPKPMCFSQDFLTTTWTKFCNDQDERTVDPDQFLIYAFEQLLEWRTPRYEALANRWGITLESADLSKIDYADEFDELVADAIAKQAGDQSSR